MVILPIVFLVSSAILFFHLLFPLLFPVLFHDVCKRVRCHFGNGHGYLRWECIERIHLMSILWYMRFLSK